MKRIIVIFALASIMLVTVNAHASGYGVRAGLNFSYFSAHEIETSDKVIEYLSDAYTGFHLGGIVYLSILNMFIQPELLYSQTGKEIAIRSLSGDAAVYHSPVLFTNRFHNISVPVLAGLKFGPLRVGIGPVANFILNSSISRDSLIDDVDFNYNTSSFGYQAMAGIKLGSLMLDLKYEGSLSRFGEGINISGQQFDFKTKQRQFIISLGILLN